MKIFFDTEFTGLHRETTLISIGLISEDGDIFYAELDDYDKNGIDDWIQENVINNLLYDGKRFEWDYPNWFYYGDSKFIREKLLGWLGKFDKVEWVSDVCHYDFVLLIDLLYGHALNMPYGKHNAACHDINQDIAEWYEINEIDAFDMSREQILKNAKIEIQGNKHNALYDAIAIKTIYEKVLN
jgi:hypothetical protein